MYYSPYFSNTLGKIRQEWCEGSANREAKQALQFCRNSQLRSQQDLIFDMWQNKYKSTVNPSLLLSNLNQLNPILQSQQNNSNNSSSIYLRENFSFLEPILAQYINGFNELGLMRLNAKSHVMEPAVVFDSKLFNRNPVIRAKAYINTIKEIFNLIDVIDEQNQNLYQQNLNKNINQISGIQQIPPDLIHLYSPDNEEIQNIILFLQNFVQTESKREPNQTLFNRNKYNFESPLICDQKKGTPCDDYRYQRRQNKNIQRLQQMNINNPDDVYGFIDDQLGDPNWQSGYFT